MRVEDGFATGDAKMAFIEGRFESRVAVPEGVLDELARQGNAGRPETRRPLLITAAELAEAEFLTDRGRRRLPAWRLTAMDTLGPIWVLDPGVVDWKPAADAGGPAPQLHAPAQPPSVRVEVGADDRTLVVDWFGAVPAFERYPKAELVESRRHLRLWPSARTSARRDGELLPATCIACRRFFARRWAPACSSTCTATRVRSSAQPTATEPGNSAPEQCWIDRDSTCPLWSRECLRDETDGEPAVGLSGPERLDGRRGDRALQAPAGDECNR